MHVEKEEIKLFRFAEDMVLYLYIWLNVCMGIYIHVVTLFLKNVTLKYSEETVVCFFFFFWSIAFLFLNDAFCWTNVKFYTVFFLYC